MTLPASFPLSMSQINTELGRATNATTSLLESAVRTLAQVPSGPVAYSNLLGKASLTVVGVGDDQTYSSTPSGGTATALPHVNVSGGQAPYTYAWSFTSNPQGATLSDATLSTASVSKTFLSGSSGSFASTLQCVVTDNLGTQRTATGVTANASWEP